jgi:hypothetical protein
MKMLQVVPRVGTHLYSAMIKKQAEIRRNGRGTFVRSGTRTRKAARWTHVRYRGSIDFRLGEADAVRASIANAERAGAAEWVHVEKRSLVELTAPIKK